MNTVATEQGVYFKKYFENISFINLLAWLCIGVALTGSVFSAFGICTGNACSDAHSYRLFGLSFAAFGIPMFLILAVARYSSRWLNFVSDFADIIIFGSAGAEIWFTVVQKYMIGHFCPVCVVIACAVFLLTVVRVAEIFLKRKEQKKMKWYRKALKEILPLTVFIIGLSVAMVGVQKAGAETGLSTEKIWLGSAKTGVEVYFISDWYCPYCRKTEPVIENMVPEVNKLARYTFVDYPVHRESFEFVPYNLSLLMTEQKRYLIARRALLDVAGTTRQPDEIAIRASLARYGVNLKMADFSSIMRISSQVSNFLRSSGVSMTPSIVIRNAKTGEQKILVGIEQIQKPIVLATIRSIGG